MRRVKKGLLIFPILKDLNQADGILIKNEGIKNGFVANGVDVDVLEFSSKGIFNRDERVYQFNPRRFLRIYEYNFTAWKAVAEYIGRNEYSFVWFRIPSMTGTIARFIIKIKKREPSCRIILEYGAYPFVNELSGVKKIFYLLNKPNERVAHQHADFVITYCGQEYVDNLVNIPINNGIDLHELPVVSTKTDLAKQINFIGVSSLKKWHAYERFIMGLADYVKKPGGRLVHFNVVGNGPEYQKLVQLVSSLGLEKDVTFYDFKIGKDLDEVYRDNHVAVGTLGFHRIGIDHSSSLKNREYFGRGLPIVLSTKDDDMPADLPYVFYTTSGEEPVDIDRVVSFAEKVYRIPGVNAIIRDYAEKNVSWESKIKTVLKYLNGSVSTTVN